MKIQRKYIEFTLSYLCITLPIIIRFSLEKQAAFGGWDAVNSMYATCLYIRRYVYEVFTNIQHGEIAIPMIGYTVGMGEDIFSTLNQFGFGDPINLLFVFFNEDCLPYVFSIILYFKIFLGGLAFILMSSELDPSKDDRAYVLGALVYSFTGFTLQCNMFIFFAHAMYCIPLMIYGAERSQKNRKGILTLATCLFALSGFFFLYIGSIALAVYILYKLITQKTEWKKSITIIYRLLIEYFLGIGLASIFLIPAIYAFLHSNRLGVAKQGYSFFSGDLLLNLFRNIFIPQYNSSLQVVSLVSIGVICILVLLTADKFAKYKFNLIVLMILTTMPIVNCIMSGFGESYDRWAIIVNLYIAFLVTQVWDELTNLNIVQKFSITFLFLILVVIGKTGHEVELMDNRRYYITVISYGIIWFTMIIAIPIVEKMKFKYTKQLSSFILLLVCVYSIFISWKESYLDKSIECVQQRNVVNELLAEDKEFYRIDNAVSYLEPGNYPNIGFLQNYHGIADYFSVQNNSYIEAMQAWNPSPQITHKIVYRGLDNRAILETLCNVKYMIFPRGEQVTIPYGFEFQKMTDDGEWVLYRNTEFLPVLYAYRSVTEKEEGMDGYSTQSLISQVACIDSYDGKLEKTDIKDISDKLTRKMISFQNKNVDGNVYTIYPEDNLTFEIDLLPQGENYILIKHEDIKNIFEVYEDDQLITKASVSPEYNNGYVGINLGCVEKKTTKKYTIKVSAEDKISIEMIYYDYSDYHELISGLRADISDLNVKTNCISANVNMQEPRVLCLAMPYSVGWSAMVDGEKTKIYRVNDMFMGIDIAEGTHEVVFKYCTPGIKVAVVITIIAIIGTVILIASNRQQNSKCQQFEDV